MNKSKLDVLEQSKNLYLKDIVKYKSIKEKLKIRLNKYFQEKIWNKAKDKIKESGNIKKWIKLSKILKVNIHSIIRFSQRSTAKPIIVYEKLIKFLKELTWKDIENNIDYLVWNKHRIKVKFPLTLADFKLSKLNPIKMKIPKIKWEKLNKYPIEKFRLNEFNKSIIIKNPYWKSKHKNHNIFKKIGRIYQIDFTKKVYIHLKDEARKRLLKEFYKKVPGINLKIKQRNATLILNYYTQRSLETISRRHNIGMPFIILLKIIKYLNNKKYDVEWLQKNLEGISSGERTYHKIKFPIKWNNKEGISILTSLLGDGGLGFRSTMWAWAVPHYAQFRHKELIPLYIKNIKKIFGINIKKRERLELPAVCGYIIVASGYFTPGHKSYTNPSLPKFIKDAKSLITCLNWLISDDGTFNVNHLSIAGGNYFLQEKPLNYMKELLQLIKYKLPWINTKIIKGKKKDFTWKILELRGGFYSIKKLYNLIKKYNGKIYANKKDIALQNYLNNHYYSTKEYNQRYKRYINARL